MTVTRPYAIELTDEPVTVIPMPGRNVSPIRVTMDATDLGFPPGQWPDKTMQFDVVFYRGPVFYTGEDGEVTAVMYRSYAGDVITVAND